MPPDERDAAYLWDMQEAILTIQRFCRDKSHQDYLTDDLFRSAVERQLEILGEASHRVSENFREQHPEIPWRGIKAQRNVIAHEYGMINDDQIWDRCQHDLPPLLESLQAALNSIN